MPHRFPVVGVIGAGHLARMMIAPATALGVDLLLFAESPNDSAAQMTSHVVGDYRDLDAVRKFAKRCTVVTFEHELVPISVIRSLEVEGIGVRPSSAAFVFTHNMNDNLNANRVIDRFDCEIAVMVARSPHGQASAWAPTQMIRREGVCTSTVTPVPGMSEKLALNAQKLALTIAKEVGVVGVMAVEMFVQGDELFVNELIMRPHESGYWTIEGSRTSQFEQHLRAILDLPLGDPAMTASYAVMGNILGGSKSDMYRPYLHLMARSPALKIHQYRKEVCQGSEIGHVTALGHDLLDLQESVAHAVDYMSGVIDE